jgi:hypothetical protein
MKLKTYNIQPVTNLQIFAWQNDANIDDRPPVKIQLTLPIMSLGFVLVVSETPQSLRRSRVSPDHDQAIFAQQFIFIDEALILMFFRQFRFREFKTALLAFYRFWFLRHISLL